VKIRLTQIDGKLPNLALMKLAHWHKAKGDDIHFSRSIERELFEPDYDAVYASTIFKFSQPKVERFKQQWPGAIVGGTGEDTSQTIEQITGPYENYDYSLYPDFKASIGFTQRGCRLKCKFCVVPSKEGKNKFSNVIDDIWRGGDYPKHLYLLDNDFFGQPDWRDRIEEIRDGNFKVCLNQGINVRLINKEAAEALASVDYRDDQFKTKRIYTAWDNIGDEKIFFKGIKLLEDAGISPKNIMAYMLVGYAKGETMGDVLTRFNKMNDREIMAYPMVFDKTNRELSIFQRWVIRRYYKVTSFAEYSTNFKPVDDNQGVLI